jgi:hypothetical protein
MLPRFSLAVGKSESHACIASLKPPPNEAYHSLWNKSRPCNDPTRGQQGEKRPVLPLRL